MGLDKLDKKAQDKLDEKLVKEYEESLAKVDKRTDTELILGKLDKLYRLIDNTNSREERLLKQIDKKVNFIDNKVDKIKYLENKIDIVINSMNDLELIDENDIERKKEIKKLEQKLKKLKEV